MKINDNITKFVSDKNKRYCNFFEFIKLNLKQQVVFVSELKSNEKINLLIDYINFCKIGES